MHLSVYKGASCKTPRWRGLMGNRPALASGLCVDGEVKLWRSYVSGMVSLVSGEVQPAGGAG